MKQLYLFASLWAFVLPLVPAQEGDLPELGSRAAVLLDATTGTILFEKNGDEEIPPASLTKLMTIHIALGEVSLGRAFLEETRSPPWESWHRNQPPRSSLMFLGPGQRVSLRELLLGLAVPSGNDAAVAAALWLAPTVEDFVERMNQEAARMGLVKTHFTEPSGISEHNRTTAREFALFCREYLRLHPESLGDYHSVGEFAYPRAENLEESFRERPGTIFQYNHNTLLGNFPGVDGLKTGYIDEAGYNIALTAERQGTRFIAVILGAPAHNRGNQIRDEDGRRLLSWAFAKFKTLRPIIDTPGPVRIWKGAVDSVGIIPGEALEFTIPLERGGGLWGEAELRSPLIAPLSEGTVVGTLILYDQWGELRRIPLLTLEDVGEGGFFKRLWDSIRLFFRSLFS